MLSMKFITFFKRI